MSKIDGADAMNTIERLAFAIIRLCGPEMDAEIPAIAEQIAHLAERTSDGLVAQARAENPGFPRSTKH